MVFPKLYPFVSLVLRPDLYAREPFAAGVPVGATVHYTADASVEGAVASYADKGYCYHLLIGRDGKVTQTAYFDKSVWHAGKALWRRESPNSHHVAIAVVSWGKLSADGHGGWQSWAKTPVPERDVVMRPDNLTGKIFAWHAATPAQEEALEKALRWLVACGINPADICGHDEAALPKGRKDDPGGVLTWTMTQLRAKLIAPQQ